MDRERRVAVIDVGSNSLKLLVASRIHHVISTLFERTEITRLSEGLFKDKILLDKPVVRNVEVIDSMVHQAKALDVDGIEIVGTMALRVAENSDYFSTLLEEKTGILLRVLSGDEEAELSFIGALSGLPQSLKFEEVTLFDIGGGSTEFVRGKESSIVDRCSLSLGSVPLTERYLQVSPVSDELLSRARHAIKEEIEHLDHVFRQGPLIGIGGTITTLAAVQLELETYKASRIHGINLSREDVHDQLLRYASRTIADRCQIAGLSPGRADIILAGACIVEEILDMTREESFTVSDRGLRHGVAMHYFEKDSEGEEPLLLP
ncbi:MAG: Ppx/GppA family phosphatase [Aminobacterium sp.]|jgi:exopolyphosphatase/guanosine-5'-triphosphate,3'-diphosphate pyrophosphatase|nr:Ppx/GppA family phosphatase [Aminobacterium sp.]